MPNEGIGIVSQLPHWHTQHQLLFQSQCGASTAQFTQLECVTNLSAMLRDLGQLTSTVLLSPGGLVRLQKSILSYTGKAKSSSKCSHHMALSQLPDLRAFLHFVHFSR